MTECKRLPFFEAAYQTQLAHYISLASNPGSKEYAREAAKALDAQQGGIFKGIFQDIAKVVNAKPGQAKAPESAPPLPEKPL